MRIVSGAHIRAIVLTLTLIIWAAPTIGAQDQATPPPATPTVAAPRFSIYPVGDYDHRWFEVTIGAGESAELKAGVANTGETPVALQTYASNASSAVNGGFVAGNFDDEAAGPTQWVDYNPFDLELAPGEAVEHAFTVTVPPDTAPGFYVIALVAQTAESLAIPGTEVLRQVIRNAVSLEITVPGDAVSGFELGAPEASMVAGQWMLDVPITNTGTTRLKPQGTLTVTDVAGNVVSTTEVKMESVYAGNATSIRVALPGELTPGEYRASLDLTDETTGANAGTVDAPFTLTEP